MKRFASFLAFFFPSYLIRWESNRIFFFFKSGPLPDFSADFFFSFPPDPPSSLAIYAVLILRFHF